MPPLSIPLHFCSHPALTLSGQLESASTNRLHVHDGHQVLMIPSGISLLEDPDTRQPLFGSMAAMIPAGLPHRSIVVGDPIRYASLYLDPALFTPARNRIRLFRISRLGEVLFRRIRLRAPEDWADPFQRKCLDLFLDVLSEDQQHPTDLARLPKARTAIGREMAAFIEAHHDAPLTIETVLKAFPYSPRHLGRLFKEDLGIPVSAYLRMFRIQTASIALADPERTITEIAFQCGYESLSSFYRDFHRIYGMPPKRFRDRIRQGEMPA